MKSKFCAVHLTYIFLIMSLCHVTSVKSKLSDISILNPQNEFLSLSVKCLNQIITNEKIPRAIVITKKKYVNEFDFTPFIVGEGVFGKRLFVDIKFKRLRPDFITAKMTSYFLFVGQSREVEDYINHLKRQKFLNLRNYFIVIPVHNTTKLNYKAIGKTLIENRVLYSIVFKASSEGFRFISNFPYRNHMCDKYSPRNDATLGFCYLNGSLDYIYKQNSDNYYAENKDSKLFPPKIPFDLQGCPIRIVTGLWPPNVIHVRRRFYPGIEIEFMNMVAKHLNFTPIYLNIDDSVGMVTSNGSWTGFMGYLQRDDADFALGSIHTDGNRRFIFEESYWFLNNYIQFIVPDVQRSKKTEFLAYLFMDSSALTKASFIVTFYVTALSLLALSKKRRTIEHKEYRKFGLIHLTLIQVFLIQPLRSPPKTVQARWIIGCWALFCTVIIFSLQTTTTSYLTAPKSPKPINSLKEVLDLGLQVTYEKYYDFILEDFEYGEEIIKRNRNLPIIKSLELVAKGEAVTLADKLRTIYITQQWLRDDGSIPIWTIEKQSKFFYYVTIVMTKGHPLYNRMDEMVLQAGYNGFWNFMVNKYITRRKILCLVRLEIALNNYLNGISNAVAVRKYNDAFHDAFPQNILFEAVNKIFYPSPVTEEELVTTFSPKNNFEKITFSNLGTMFKFLLVGHAFSTIVFIAELVYKNFFEKNGINISRRSITAKLKSKIIKKVK